MSMVDTTILSWINAEVEQALKNVRETIARFSAAPEDVAVLAGCPGHLHQVSGALRMVGLAGATRFCEALENSFTGVSAGDSGRAAAGVIDRAVLALKDFVGDLSRGHANVPLRLFPAYKDLTALQGRNDISEKELFFPDLTLQAPAHANPHDVAAPELPAYLQAQRARFQRGVLALLRNQPVNGVEEMRKALEALHQVAAQLPEPRGFWWVAMGFVEAAGNPKEAPDWLAQAKPLCNKIDFQLRDLAAGSAKASEALLKELLFAVAKSSAATAQVQAVKELYKLESLFADPAQAQAERSRDVAGELKQVRARLEALKSAWLKYIAGDARGLARFRELIGELKAQSPVLGVPSFGVLIEAIDEVASRLPEAYPRQKHFMVVEMASAFLLAENTLEPSGEPAGDLDEQARIMGGWLQDAAAGKSSGEPPPGLRDSLLQQIGKLQLRAQVAKEITANLQHVEQVLDSFARNSAKRDTLQGLEPYLRQINGALVVLGFDRAADVLAICETLIATLAAADHEAATEDMDWIAEGLSSLGFFLEPCQRGREPAAESIDLFFRRFERRNAQFSPEATVMTSRPAAHPDAPEPGPEPAPAPEIELPTLDFEGVPEALPEPVAAPAASREGINEELLGIYLEEAGEVLATIDGTLPQCRSNPDDRDSLTTIRRAFHTLKGSGRMVGLMDLGEVAWEVEQVMNRWLEQQRPATEGLMELVTKASAAFAGWIGELSAGRLQGEIQAVEIVALARRLKAGEAPAQPLAVDMAEAAEPGAEAAAPADEAQPGLFEIYAAEAVQHLSTLEREFAAWKSAEGEAASHEFMRAAHTLASSSRTAGYEQIGDLAGILEQWMPFSRQAHAAADVECIQAGIARLNEMVASVSLREVPRAAEEVAGRLHEMNARLEGAPEPVAEKPAAPVLEKLAEPGAAAPSGRELRKLHDDIDEQLLPIFLEEAQELLPQIGSDLRDWKANSGDERIAQSLQRGLHTLKGSARMAGAIRLGELTHLMESRIEAAIGAGQYPAELFAELEDKMDRLSLDLERMSGKEAQLAAPAPDATVAVAVAPAQPAPAPSVPRAAPAAPKAEAPLPSPAASLRINAETLDHLITESGEVSIARSRIEAELRGVKQSLADLSDSISRLRGQLREVEVQADSQMQSRMSVMEERKGEFDPLEFDRYTRLQELTRMMAETLHDISSIQQAMHKHLGDSDAAVLHQARISRDVQQELMRMRAVPFSNLNERLYRIVRQTARELEKKAELEIEGAQVELDRSVLERIGAPLEHMLRNALAHGLETPAERLAAGKPETGRIGITLRQESNEIALVLSDDGAGIDLEKLQRKAVEKGLLPPGGQASDGELAQLIFVSGLSTADTVTQLAGRGVGMDVVRSEIASIGGRVDIATTGGKGTSFAIYLPLTLAVTQAVMVRSGPTTIALSSAMVEQVLRLKADAMASLYDTRLVQFQDRSYPLHYFQHLLGGSGPIDVQTYNSVLLLRSGIQRVAVHVDELIGNQEIVVKNIGPQLARVPGVAGATVLPDGSIVLIMNPVPLAQRAKAVQAKLAMELVGTSTRAVRGIQAAASATAVPTLAAIEPALAEELPTAEASPQAPALVFAADSAAASHVVMVVDDSLTVRKITSRLLEREGYTVLTAKDGVDALEQMKESLPGVMLVDIEMPRMDGFDLARNVRADSRTAGIPIIIISSRTADKHRNQAAQLGVNAFLGKPYQESELLQHVAAYLSS